MKLRLEISGNELFVKGGFRPAWYYGFAYRQTRAFASVYYIIPLNLIIRFWRWLQIFFWTIIFKVIYQFAKLYMWWRYKRAKP